MKSIQHQALLFGSRRSARAEDESFPRHMHDEYEIFYFLESRIDYFVGEKVFPLVPYDLLLIPPAVYHFPVLKGDAPYRRMVLNFPEELVPPELRERLRRADVCRQAPPDRGLGRLMFEAESAAGRYDSGDAALALEQIFGLILLEFKYERPSGDKAAGGSEGSEALPPRIREIVHYIDGHLTEPMSISSLAARFFVSPSWLTHAFAEFLHIGVLQYVNTKKILRARRLIRSGLPPTQAAEACGFAGYSTFFRLYRRILGRSPAEDKP